MHFSRKIVAICVLGCAGLFGQPAASTETQGVPPRAGGGEYQAQAKAGSIVIAGDFVGHAVPTMQGTFSSEDYVVVEIGFFGGADAKAKLSFEDFSLKINGKKMPVAAVQYGLVMKSLSDPEWIPETPAGEGPKSKGGLSTGGGGGSAGDPKPLPPKMPFPLRRAMEQKVQKAALPEGDRALPIAGLIFFPYRGKDTSIHEVELIYNGAAGKATLNFPR